MENQQLVSTLWQCSNTPVGFGQGFLSKEQCDNTGESQILSWPGCRWFLFFPLNEIGIEGTDLTWCYWRHQECHGRAEKALTKWFPGIFLTTLQSPAVVYSCTMGLFWRKCSLYDCIVVYFWAIVIPGTFWILHIRGAADKYLARPERKQATATKLGFYSTYSPRCSIHFLARCSNFSKLLKKKIQKVARPTWYRRQQWPPRRTKNGELSILRNLKYLDRFFQGLQFQISWQSVQWEPSRDLRKDERANGHQESNSRFSLFLKPAWKWGFTSA
jgi:hypothetical protein